MNADLTGRRHAARDRAGSTTSVRSRTRWATRHASSTRRSRDSGNAFDYPDTAFGQSLRWTADMIETGCPTRVYYVTIGSFDTPAAASFDTHIEQLAKHKTLFSELGRGLTRLCQTDAQDRAVRSRAGC